MTSFSLMDHEKASLYTREEIDYIELTLEEIVKELKEAGNVMAAPDRIETTKNQIAAALFRYVPDAQGDLINLKELAKSSLGGGATLSASNPNEAV